MEKEFKEALYEVNEILKQIPAELLNKIPVKFQKLIDENKSCDCKWNVNINDLSSLKKETIIILGLIYRDFLNENKEKNIYTDLFSKKNELKEEKDNIADLTEETKDLLVIKDEKWYKKLFEFVKNVFKKK